MEALQECRQGEDSWPAFQDPAGAVNREIVTDVGDSGHIVLDPQYAGRFGHLGGVDPCEYGADPDSVGIARGLGIPESDFAQP